MKKQSEKKCVIEGCATIAQEEKILATKAQRSVIEHNKWEKKHKFERVPILHGYILKLIK